MGGYVLWLKSCSFCSANNTSQAEHPPPPPCIHLDYFVSHVDQFIVLLSSSHIYTNDCSILFLVFAGELSWLWSLCHQASKSATEPPESLSLTLPHEERSLTLTALAETFAGPSRPWIPTSEHGPTDSFFITSGSTLTLHHRPRQGQCSSTWIGGVLPPAKHQCSWENCALYSQGRPFASAS